jgi:hypothetical protein
MPEIAAAGLVGAIVTFIAVNLNLYWVHRTFQSPALKTLNHNLSKANRFWSIEQGRLLSMDFSEETDALKAKDYQKATRSAFLFGTLMIFLSWFGFLLFTLYFLSTHKFAKSRVEQRIFDSDLIRNEDLKSNQVEQILQDMESLGS